MRIIRFIDVEGFERLGEPLSGETARLVEGSLFSDIKAIEQVVEIKRLLPPLLPCNIFAIGLNYRDHTSESGFAQPERPVVFMKSTASIVAHMEPVEIPSDCLDPPQVDYEGELAVVIGRAVKNVPKEKALDCVLGYTVANDVSARRWQKHAGAQQWVKGKSFDSFCPLGPGLVLAESIADVQNLQITTRLNGQTMQYSSTANMIFGVAELISYLSANTTLLPGTVILTGTPEGVGFARQPPIFMMPGDHIEVEIESIGCLQNPVVSSIEYSHA